MKNLDLLAAKSAQTIIEATKKINSEKVDAGKVDNLVTKALGVLQENGVYAAFLYLYSRSERTDKFIAEKTRNELLRLLEELGMAPKENNASAALKFLTDNVCSNIDRLLLVKQVWEQALIYARYGAKARGAEDGAAS